jgi:hypothetical protein
VEHAIAVGIAIAIAAALSARPRDERKYVAKRLRDREPTAIRGVAEGRDAVIAGSVVLVEPERFVIAPISGKACVFWMVLFDEVGAGDWRRIGRGAAGCEFLVEDETATARVVPGHAEVDLPGQAVSRPCTHWDLPSADIVVQLARRVCKPPNHPYQTALRATEHIVVAGARVVVGGACSREPDPRATEAVTGYRDQLPTRPVLSGSRRTPLVIRAGRRR